MMKGSRLFAKGYNKCSSSFFIYERDACISGKQSSARNKRREADVSAKAGIIRAVQRNVRKKERNTFKICGVRRAKQNGESKHFFTYGKSLSAYGEKWFCAEAALS